MIDFLYKILHKTKGKKGHLLIYRCIKLFLNVYYPFKCKVLKNVTSKNIAKGTIISLTTFPARIDSVWITIETLLRQTVKPEKIILWLANSQFESKDKLPNNLLNLEKRGLEIKLCDDLRSHKKYYYTMKNHPNHIIITVDDDMFYPESLVESLLSTHKKFPNTICCNLAHLITVENGVINKYQDWISGADGYDKPSYYLVPIGCEGVLYPPNSLDQNVFNKEQIKELSPLADDLWLKAMATLKGIKTVKTDSKSFPFVNIFSFKDVSLTKLNVGEQMNDKQLTKIIKTYPILKDFWK